MQPKQTAVMGEGTASRKTVETVYRGWTIIRRWNGRYSVSRHGWQSRHNLKDIESARAMVDAIVG